MVTLCWAAKGGSGTTVVTATLALDPARPSLLVDLAGELPTVLGLAEPDRPGVVDWLTSEGSAAQLHDLVVDVDSTTALLPRSLADRPIGPVDRDAFDPHRWRHLLAWLDQWQQQRSGTVWIDHGTGDPDPVLADVVPRRLLVTRPCYLALRRAGHAAVRPTGVVLVEERGRALRSDDVERCLGAPIEARVTLDPKVARAVDSGLLVTRVPMSIRSELRRLVA